MEQTYLRDLLHRYQQGECTPAEKQIVEDWYDVLGHERELKLSQQEQQTIKAALWSRIAQDTFEAHDISPPAAAGWGVWRRVGSWVAAAAAVVAVGLGAQKLLLTPTAATLPGSPVATATHPQWLVHPNATSQPELLTLPDGSHVTLSPRSELKYPTRFTATKRTVYLKGEAFFDVYHDKAHPFLVYTRNVVTTVLGTSFLVQAPENKEPVVVQVKTGRVRVTPRQPETATATLPASIVVLPNQQAVYRPVQHQLQRELVAKPVLLAPQPFTFDDRPVPEVLTALEKAYGVTIDYDAAALAGCTVNLSLPNESLYGKLDVLCQTLGASYTVEDARILFHSRGCSAR